MNIFGLGPLEIILILVIALIVFGPAKLPEIMGQVGKAIADFRRATSDLSDEFNRTIQAELQETRALVDETRSTVSGLQTSINSAMSGTATSAVATAAPALTAPAPVANGTNGSNGSYTPAESPPMADTAQWSWETSAPAPGTPAVVVAPPAVDETPKVERRRTRSDDLLPPY
jgi:sec-independent protein translocase protein TatB